MNIAPATQARRSSFGPLVVGNLVALVLGPLGFVLGIVGLVACSFGMSAEGRGDSARADRHRTTALAAARLGIWGSLVLLVLGAIPILLLLFRR